MKSKAKEYALMNIGVILLSVGVYFFKIPNGFSTGGVSGLGTILGKLLPVITPANWIIIINTLLLFLGFIFLGKETGLRTVYCSLAYSMLTRIFEIVLPLNFPLTNQPFLELCYAMLLTGIGSALIFNSSASSGGTDIIALILKKHTCLDVGKSLIFTDFLIALSSFFVFGIKTGLFSLLGLFIKAFMIDGIIESLNSYKYFIVVTDKHKEVSEYIMKTLHHGVTSTDSVGDFTQSSKTMIHTVCRRIEAIKLRNKVREIDPHAFIIITTTSEIIGRGFRAI